MEANDTAWRSFAFVLPVVIVPIISVGRLIFR